MIFALRTAGATLLAGYVAFLVDLPQASTSMMTVLIVSQPLAGMVLSKSLYRVVGTCVGAIAAVVFTAALYDAPELFAVVASLWVGACVAASIYLRDAPAAYGALLSGYTIAIVAFPAVETPDAIFMAALWRASEIFVGILCATVLSQVVFPQQAAGALRAATESALAAASAWAADTLRGRPDPARVLRDRRSIVANVVALEGLRVQANFDSPSVRMSNRRLRLLHGRLMSFLALLVSVHDRLEVVAAERPERLAALRPLLLSVADAMARETTDEVRASAERALTSAAPRFEDMRRDPEPLIERSILLRSRDLLLLREELDLLATPREDSASAFKADGPATLVRYRDYGLALVAGVTAALSLLATFAFWIATGWPAGASAALQVAVMVSLFAQQDNPAVASGAFLRMTAAGAAAAALYGFVILPRLEGFDELAMALAPLLLGIAYFMGSPRTGLPALAFGLGALSMMGLSRQMTLDFAGFANTVLASLAGIALATVLLRVLRPIGAAWPIARLTRGVREELADVSGARRPPPRLVFESRMFDRINSLMTRLDLANPDHLAIEQGALAGLRVGLNALALRRYAAGLPPPVAEPIGQALDRLSDHFRRLARGEPSRLPLAELDAALAAALDPGLAGRQDAADLAVAVAALRGSLSRHPAMFGAAAA